VPDRSDDDILDPKAMAQLFGVTQRTIIRMAHSGRAPRPIGGLKKPYRWRWGAVRKWHEAMETLYGVGAVSVFFDQNDPETVEDEQKPAPDSEAPSGPKKGR
jgi:predicted DNA-binding transcriptional regulator AlpA